jgi:hypothetical protein
MVFADLLRKSNTMKKILLTIFALTIATGCLFGQDVTPSYQKHIGFNTNIILNGIFQSGATPFSFMYKKQSSENKALRLGSSVHFNIEDVNQGIQKQRLQSFSFEFSIGKEVQKSISQRWVWYGGGDVIPLYSTLTNEQIDTGLPAIQKNSQSIFSLTASPFMGIRFNIAPRLYVSTEASLFMSYRKQNSTNEVLNSKLESNSDRFTLGINPATSIYFFYLF